MRHTEMQSHCQSAIGGSAMAVSSNMEAVREDQPIVLRELLMKYLKIYCERSTMHGVRYIFNNNLNKLERLCWTIIVMAAVAISLSGYFSLLNTYNEQIILTVIDDSHYSVVNIPFPAVAICNNERINWNRFEEAQERFLPPNSPNETLMVFREFVKRMQSLRFGAFTQFNNTDDMPLEKINSVNVTELAFFLAFQCDELFDGPCLWRGNMLNCCEIFIMEKTESGFCLVFNSAISSESKRKMANDKFYPWRNFKSGEKSGLYFQIKLNSSSTEKPSKDEGVDLMLKKNEQWTDVVYSIKANTESLVVISPELKTTDSGTLGIPPEVRGCMFDSESDHYLFKNIKGLKYWQWNCITVCHEEYLLKICNCTVSMFFPQNDSYRECAPADFRCLYQFRDVFSYDKRLNEEKYVNNIKSGMVCPCLVRCDTCLQYYATVSSLPIIDPIPNNTRIMVVDVHYQSDAIIKYRTIREITFMELIASLGGIVGLFLGASILSGIEIIYHLTIGLFMFLKDNQYFDQIRDRFRSYFKIHPQGNQISANTHNPTKKVWHETSNRSRRRY